MSGIDRLHWDFGGLDDLGASVLDDGGVVLNGRRDHDDRWSNVVDNDHSRSNNVGADND